LPLNVLGDAIKGGGEMVRLNAAHYSSANKGAGAGPRYRDATDPQRGALRDGLVGADVVGAE
jgi:hypothetical protein